MTVDIYQIDAFTTKLFGGNPAAVCPLEEWIPNETLLNIAKENNLAETAYFVHKGDNVFHLRWFTPEIEMDLCGHATLASAYVIFHCLNYNLESIVFETLSGELLVTLEGSQIEMNFPSRPPKVSNLPQTISDALSIQPKEIFKARDYLLLFESENDIVNLKVNSSVLNKINIDPGGIIVTSKGERVDFVSRFFTPGAAVFEDPVTGSAHCTLVPFWSEKLNKSKLHARQISERSGELFCELKNNRVFIKGFAVKYLQGIIEV
jgi:PhzF family phenazine biosynthesis protein